jgi:hypothetical protein
VYLFSKEKKTMEAEEEFDLSRMKDYTGRKLGILTFVRPIKRHSKWRTTIWEAICECGRTVLVVPGKSKGCGSECGIFPSSAAGVGWRAPYRPKLLIEEIKKEGQK